ncbi:MAG TPA: glutaredoxin family protein, partial [Anaerolineales bacterium]
MIEITLYTRTGCQLCDEAQAELETLQGTIPHRLVVVDVDSSAGLQQAYGSQVPVVEAGPYLLKAPFSAQELHMTLAAAQDRENHQAAIDRSIEQREVFSGHAQGRPSGGRGFETWEVSAGLSTGLIIRAAARAT